MHVGTNTEVVQALRQQMREFKETVDKVIVLWSANTEMFYLPEIHTADALEKKIRQDEPLPSSVLYAFAAIKEGITYLNGSPQNTLHPGVVELATMEGTFVGGSDFKSGQTKFKTIMSDFLIGTGMKLSAVASYNHLGNNDGKNLSEDKCF